MRAGSLNLRPKIFLLVGTLRRCLRWDLVLEAEKKKFPSCVKNIIQVSYISVKNNIIRLKFSQSYFLIQVHHLHIQTRVAFDFWNGSTFLGLPKGQNMVTLYGGTSVKKEKSIFKQP